VSGVSAQPVLELHELAVSFPAGEGVRARAVDGVSLQVHRGRTLAVVGESGCGKSVTAMSVLGLVPTPPARIDAGRIVYRYEDGREADLLRLDQRAMRGVRGGEIAMIFQEPMTSLNPVFTIGDQLVEAVRLHQNLGRREAIDAAARALEAVGISDPRARMRAYPHQFSGGMRQRVMIAMALACEPRVLLADEPTTALDVTIQAQILELIDRLKRERQLGVMLITHDLGVVAGHADDVAVMYAGRVVESARVDELFARPLHPYTRGLLACIPRVHQRRERLSTVRELGEDASAFDAPGERAGTRAWWPWHERPAGVEAREGPAGDSMLVEVAPGHRVALWRTRAARETTGVEA
jgi:oligopeptide transport system ATP-binding protein